MYLSRICAHTKLLRTFQDSQTKHVYTKISNEEKWKHPCASSFEPALHGSFEKMLLLNAATARTSFNGSASASSRDQWFLTCMDTHWLTSPGSKASDKNDCSKHGSLHEAQSVRPLWCCSHQLCRHWRPILPHARRMVPYL